MSVIATADGRRRTWGAASAVSLRIALGALAFRLVSALLAFFVNITFPLHQREQFTVFGSTSPFWDTFARYDTGYFEGIAWGGYAPAPGGRSNIAYFPVYPMLIRCGRPAVRPAPRDLLHRRHRHLVGVFHPGDGGAVLPGAARSPAASRGAGGLADDDLPVRVSSSASRTARARFCCSPCSRSTVSGRGAGCSAACAARSRRPRACRAS